MAPRKTPTTKSTTRTKRATTTRSKPKDVAAPKPSKPVFRTGTWVTLIVFLAVVGAIFYLNSNPIQTEEEKAAAAATPTSEPAFVFDSASNVTSIEVKPVEGETVKVERDEDKAWVITQPFEIEADPGLAEAAASQVTSLLITSEIDGNPPIFGFDEPLFVITVEFEDGSKGTLEVGDVTPTNSGYYVRLDKDKMFIVTMTGIDALTNLVFAPPYLNTPTPTATATLPPTATAVPATEAESTPEATPTP